MIRELSVARRRTRQKRWYAYRSRWSSTPASGYLLPTARWERDEWRDVCLGVLVVAVAVVAAARVGALAGALTGLLAAAYVVGLLVGLNMRAVWRVLGRSRPPVQRVTVPEWACRRLSRRTPATRRLGAAPRHLGGR